MKKVVVAMDAFKGSMTSLEAGNAGKEGILQVHPDWRVEVYPVADGGEGTVDALTYGKAAVSSCTCEITGPLGERRKAGYISYENEQGKVAVIEVAAAAGLPLIPTESRNPMRTTTYGVGELIRHAVLRGCRQFVIGLGGSGTNDGGVGMLQALGYRFLDADGREISYGAEGVSHLADIRWEKRMPELADCTFRVACDVKNPLTGEQGCSAVFAPQKGADVQMIPLLEQAMEHYADIVEQKLQPFTERNMIGHDRYTPGSGAAGGLGYAFLMFLHAGLEPGVEIVLDEIHLEEAIATADYVVTGEGRMDGQTLMGKTPYGVAVRAKTCGEIPVLAFAGCFGTGIEACKDSGLFKQCYAVADEVSEEEQRHALETVHAFRNLKRCVANVFREL